MKKSAAGEAALIAQGGMNEDTFQLVTDIRRSQEDLGRLMSRRVRRGWGPLMRIQIVFSIQRAKLRFIGCNNHLVGGCLHKERLL